jgi:phage protein D
VADGRRVRLDVQYNNNKISSQIAPFITGWTYTDNLSGVADDISIALADREKRWMNAWMPQKGATLKAAALISWDSTSTVRQYLGAFEIDEIEINGPPSVAIVRAISVPESSPLRLENRNRAWEKTTLKKVASDIAKRNKLKLYFDSDENPDYDRVEQSGESDVRFLSRLCNDAGLALKITNNSIAIIDEAKYEQKPPTATIDIKDKGLLEYKGRTSLFGTYRNARVSYTPPKKKKPVQVIFTPPKAPKTGRTLIINEQVKTYSEAMRLAKKRLRQENKDETTFYARFAGIRNFYAGRIVSIKGFGKFDGKYIVTRMAWTVGKSTQTEVDLRKCLEGY